MYQSFIAESTYYVAVTFSTNAMLLPTYLLQGFKNLEAGIADAFVGVPIEIEEGKPMDKLIFIYTSGTTGLPKAAVIKEQR